jgi:geranylgeranyl diphosphate synthase, type II
MVLQKTCWLAVIHPLRVGCLIGARGGLPLDPLIRIGFFCGSAFQIRDDILNVLAGSDYGKDPNGDLVEGKRTLLLIHALRHADSMDRAKLARFLDEPASRRSHADFAWVRGLIDRLGSITYATTVADSLGGAALFEFDKYSKLLPESRDLSFIRSIMTWASQRQQ